MVKKFTNSSSFEGYLLIATLAIRTLRLRNDVACPTNAAGALVQRLKLPCGKSEMAWSKDRQS